MMTNEVTLGCWTEGWTKEAVWRCDFVFWEVVMRNVHSCCWTKCRTRQTRRHQEVLRGERFLAAIFLQLVDHHWYSPFNSQIQCFSWSVCEMIYQDICAKDVLTVTESIVITTVIVTEDTTEVWRFTYCSWQHDDVSIRTTHARTVTQATMSKLTTQYITQSFLTFIRASSDHCFQVCAGGSHEGLDYSPVVLVSSVSAASGGRESNSNNLIFCWTLSEKTHRYSTLW